MPLIGVLLSGQRIEESAAGEGFAKVLNTLSGGKVKPVMGAGG